MIHLKLKTLSSWFVYKKNSQNEATVSGMTESAVDHETDTASFFAHMASIFHPVFVGLTWEDYSWLVRLNSINNWKLTESGMILGAKYWSRKFTTELSPTNTPNSENISRIYSKNISCFELTPSLHYKPTLSNWAQFLFLIIFLKFYSLNCFSADSGDRLIKY